MERTKFQPNQNQNKAIFAAKNGKIKGLGVVCTQSVANNAIKGSYTDEPVS